MYEETGSEQTPTKSRIRRAARHTGNVLKGLWRDEGLRTHARHVGMKALVAAGVMHESPTGGRHLDLAGAYNAINNPGEALKGAALGTAPDLAIFGAHAGIKAHGIAAQNRAAQSRAPAETHRPMAHAA